MLGLLYKIRKHGFVRSCKMSKLWLYRSFVFYCKLFIFVFTSNSSGKKRILGIWDYKALPWSVGDPLLFIEKLSVMKIEQKAETVDVCIIYDREHPGGNRDEVNINTENAQDFILDFLPLFKTCPYFGSVFLFNSRSEMRRFIKQNMERYVVFPSLNEHLREALNYFDYGISLYNDIHKFYESHGYIPFLRVGDRNESWAQWFYLNYLPGPGKKIPVALSLRQPKSSMQKRNADPAVWLSFIDRCKTEFPEVVFVVVGLREEIFDGLRGRENVVVAKDYGTSIIEDCALIRASLFYMGTHSGINLIAVFSELPFLLFQADLAGLRTKGLETDVFCLHKDKQNIFDVNPVLTSGFLFDEFQKLYSNCDKQKWFDLTLKNACNKQSSPAKLEVNMK